MAVMMIMSMLMEMLMGMRMLMIVGMLMMMFMRMGMSVMGVLVGMCVGMLVAVSANMIGMDVHISYLLLIYFFCICEDAGNVDGNGKMAHLCCPKNIIQKVAAARLVHLDHCNTGDLVMRENSFQFGGNIKVRLRTADQSDLTLRQFIVEGRTCKCAAIGCDQQMGVMKIWGHRRYFPKFDGPLGQFAGLIIKHLLVIFIIVFPGVKLSSNHNRYLRTDIIS
jgi:hypothetical protein